MSDLHSGRTLAIVSIICPLPGFKHAIYHAHATSPSTCCLITWKANIGTDFLTNFCLQHWRLNCELSCILSKTHDTLRAVLTIPLMVDTVRYGSNSRLVDILDGSSLKQRSDHLLLWNQLHHLSTAGRTSTYLLFVYSTHIYVGKTL